jgi:hypothetical protein
MEISGGPRFKLCSIARVGDLAEAACAPVDPNGNLGLTSDD